MTQQIGSYFIDRDQPSLSPAEAKLVLQFHDLYYRHWLERGADTLRLSWFGYEITKCPLDLWIYQELLVRTRPDFLVETGTWCGGSALYFAMLFDHLDHGEVITIDIDIKPNRPVHPRIRYLTGSSVDPVIVAQMYEAVGSSRALVVLDSDHKADHVYEEIMAYKGLVQIGDYLIVEDTNLNGHPVWQTFGPGPMEAVEKFLARDDDFMIDHRCERFLMTQHPKGFLRRAKPASFD